MRGVYVLALNSLREMFRDRTVSLVFFAAVILVVISSFLGALSLDEQRRILIHLGFAAIHWSVLGLVLFQGSFSLQREIDRQTCLMVLARPLHRSQFLIGKFFGLSALLFLHVLAQGILLYALLGFGENLGLFAAALMGILLEALVILAFILFIAQWVRPVVAIFGGLGLALVGNWLEEMRFLAEKSKDEGFMILAGVFQRVFPNFYLLNFRSEHFLEVGSPNLQAGLLFLHFSIWLILFLLLAIRSFARRDLV